MREFFKDSWLAFIVDLTNDIGNYTPNPFNSWRNFFWLFSSLIYTIALATFDEISASLGVSIPYDFWLLRLFIAVLFLAGAIILVRWEQLLLKLEPNSWTKGEAISTISILIVVVLSVRSVLSS